MVWSRRRGNLHAELTVLVGRTNELDQVHALLGTTRLLTVTGPGGSGKSRVALRAAIDEVDRFPHGVFLVELANAKSFEDVLAAVADELHIELGAGRIDALASKLRDSQLLVLLDNCDHVREASATFSRLLLERCPRAHVLATSREVLRVSGEAVWTVPPLSLPDPGESTVEGLLLSDAAHLFVERVDAAMPGFNLSKDDIRLVVEICQRLDGVPLALELAAARARSLGLRQLTSLLGDPGGMLNLSAQTAELPRHRSVRACIDWTYDLLEQRERFLLGRVSLLSGSWTFHDVERACVDTSLAASHVVDVLDTLVSKSLIVVTHQAAGTRYWVLELIRQYALERLAASDTAALSHGRLGALPHPLDGQLTPREHDVLELVARGCSNREIGAALVISEATARVHVEHILAKLALRSRTQAAVWALQRGLVASTCL